MSMNKFLRFSAAAGILAVILPSLASAATTTAKTVKKPAAPAYQPVYSGWIPFWKKDNGTAETLQHLDVLKEIMPFSFEVDPTIGVVDKMNALEDPWPQLLAEAKNRGVKVIPSIAFFNADQIHAILKDPVKRRIHIEDILGTVLLHDLDGIDIDYEGKKVATKPYFSAFIKELSATMHAHKKVLSCTVESRTPATSRTNVSRSPMEYANDYAVLNKYCDEVRIMTYDQADIDKKLNKTKGTTRPYLPVADPAWVEKVINETLKSINRSKLVLGIPTYGYEYLWSPGAVPTWEDKTRSLTFAQAMRLASTTGMTPVRNSAGELSFVYVPGMSANQGFASTSTIANARVVWFTDAEAIQQKIALVKKYKLRGASFFKFDGDADQKFWDLLAAK